MGISVLALLFTASSFWWLNARRGRLKCFPPHSFAAKVSPDSILLRFPFVFYNPGAQPLVIENLSMKFDAAQGREMKWHGVRTTLMAARGAEDKMDLPAVFFVPGRSAQQLFLEFKGEGFESILAPKEFNVRLRVKLGHRKKWSLLRKFPLHLERVRHPGSYAAYSNSPLVLTEAEVVEIEAALNQAATPSKKRNEK
ncbi:hypothetical protein [Nocardiopsis sp. YSL2]|uniref:hypothetical protein n=1 Tax=Nocardiopsis sp. YSL2 TaxID=2939492 RepID=UPI0026F45E8D|nr:hypothetical protein [Nocardiopsis sp. YSL2]